MTSLFLFLYLLPVFLSTSTLTVFAASFTITNNCPHPVWPGVLASAGTSPLSTTGFLLLHGESNTLSAPPSWSGRIWGRTSCTQDDSTTTTGSNFSCLTGDCASNNVECSGAGAAPPATLAEFTLNGADGLDFYDVSLVDGYNLPMLVVPLGGTNCSSTGCLMDINSACPSELKVVSADIIVACKSACDAFQKPEYCCSGEYASPQTCKPSSYSEMFKKACPRAYSYAYDDGTSTFTCASANYLITFCPPLPSTQKSSQYPAAPSLGGQDASAASSLRVADGRVLDLRIAVVVAAIWQLWRSFNS